jgi:hypothetical protein
LPRDANTTMTLSPGAFAGLLLTLPFALLELWHRGSGPGSLGNFPFPLFVLMWVLPMFAVNAVAPIVRGATRSSVLARPAGLVLRLAGAAVSATLWALVVQDQLPCFMGVPNCD